MNPPVEASKFAVQTFLLCQQETEARSNECNTILVLRPRYVIQVQAFIINRSNEWEIKQVN